MKRTIGFAAAAILCSLAAIQLGSDGLFGAAAVAGSIPAALPRSVGNSVYGPLGAVPFPTFIRRAAVQAALEARDFARAETLLGELPPGADRDDLQGRLFEARGEEVRAVAQYVAAGDFVRVSDFVDALERSGHPDAALREQRVLVAELERLHQTDSLAHAYWRLAQLESVNGEHRAALERYDEALVLEPLSETYLLGAANEAMGDGDLAQARADFARVVALDPGSLDGHIGIGRVAARSGDLPEARRQAAIVARSAPDFHELPFLQRDIESAAAVAR